MAPAKRRRPYEKNDKWPIGYIRPAKPARDPKFSRRRCRPRNRRGVSGYDIHRKRRAGGASVRDGDGTDDAGVGGLVLGGSSDTSALACSRFGPGAQGGTRDARRAVWRAIRERAVSVGTRRECGRSLSRACLARVDRLRGRHRERRRWSEGRPPRSRRAARACRLASPTKCPSPHRRRRRRRRPRDDAGADRRVLGR